MVNFFKRTVIALLICTMMSANFFVSSVRALDDTTWQDDWRYLTGKWQDEDIIILRSYKGDDVDEIKVPAKAVMNGVEYQVWLRDPKPGSSYTTRLTGDRAVKKVSFEEGVKAGYNLTNLFVFNSWSGTDVLEEVDLTGLDTSDTVNMSRMFYGCRYLKKLNLGNIDTSKVTRMDQMFMNLYSLESLDISCLDTSAIDPDNGGKMFGMFDNTFYYSDGSLTGTFAKDNIRKDSEYKYPAYSQNYFGNYGFTGPNGVERIFCLNPNRESAGTVVYGDPTSGMQYYKVITPEEYLGSGYKTPDEKPLTEDDLAKIATAIIFMDELPLTPIDQNRFRIVQQVIRHITNDYPLDDAYEGIDGTDYYNDYVLPNYEKIKGNYKMEIYVPETKSYQNFVTAAIIVEEKTVEFKGKKILEGREFVNGDEFTFTLKCDDKSAPMPELDKITVTPTSGNEVEFKFEDIIFSANQIGKKYTYRVIESGYGKNIINDTDEHTITVSVENKDGKLAVDCEYSDGESIVFKNRFYENFLIRKIDQFKNPLKGVRFAVYGKPIISAEAKIKITKERSYPDKGNISQPCMPSWDGVSDGQPCGDGNVLVFYLYPEVTVLIEGIDDVEFKEEHVIAADNNSVETRLKTGKYRISEIIPKNTMIEDHGDMKQQSYLKSYEIEIDNYGQLTSKSDPEWTWLVYDKERSEFKEYDKSLVNGWDENVNVKIDDNEIIITNYSGYVEHPLTLSKVRDFPQICPSDKCVPKDPENPKSLDDLVPSEMIEPTDSAEPNLQLSYCPIEDCDLTLEQLIDYYYIDPEITIVIEGINNNYLAEIVLEKNQNSKEIKLRPGKYNMKESYEIPEEILIYLEQSYLKSFEFEVTAQGEIVRLSEPVWGWLSYYESPWGPEYSGYDLWNESDYENEKYVSVVNGDSDIIITNFSYRRLFK